MNLLNHKNSIYYQKLSKILNEYRIPAYIYYTISGLLFLLILFLLFTVLLKKQVNKKTALLKKAYDELLEKDRTLQDFVNALPDLVLILDKEGTYIDIWTAKDSLLYKERNKLIGRKISEIFPKDLSDFFLKIINKVLETQKMEIINYELDVLKGKTYFEGRVAPIYKDKQYVLWLAIDITDKVELERKLNEEREKTLSILKSIGDGVIAIDKNEKIIFVNKAVENITGYKSDELINRKYNEKIKFINAKDNSPYIFPLDSIFNNGVMKEYIKNCILIDKNGNKKFIEDSIAPLFDADSKINGAVIIFRDVTSLKLMENEILQLKQLEAVGRLAGGLAHDFNNYLTGILGNIELVKILTKDNKKVQERIENIIKTIEKAKGITFQLLTFSKGGAPVTKVTNIKDLLKETAEFVFAGTSIKVIYNIREDLANVEVDINQINQVVTNIYINAKEALNGKGIVEIKAENIDMPILNNYNLDAGKYVKISIKDNGPGIAPEIKEHIFEPFVTSKKDGNGLGLSVCYQIIKKHGGLLTFNKSIEKGAEFIIFLKAVKGTPEKEELYVSEDKKFHCKILYMDDDEALRETFSSFGEFFGCDVTTVENGEKALEIYNESFDIVVLDLTVSGVETAKELLTYILLSHQVIPMIMLWQIMKIRF